MQSAFPPIQRCCRLPTALLTLRARAPTTWQSFRRLIWVPIAALPLGLGFLGILFEPERRGWPDRRAHTVVCYSDPDLDKDLV